MTLDTLQSLCNDLNKQLHKALSSMEHSDEIFEIRKQLKHLQDDVCPHRQNDVNFNNLDTCPICGKKFKR